MPEAFESACKGLGKGLSLRQMLAAAWSAATRSAAWGARTEWIKPGGSSCNGRPARHSSVAIWLTSCTTVTSVTVGAHADTDTYVRHSSLQDGIPHLVTAVVVGLASATVIASAAHAPSVEVVCTGTETVQYNPGLLLTPQTVHVNVTGILAPCSSSDAGLTDGNYQEGFDASLFCATRAPRF
ncbi:hypothetical protein ACH4VR_25375 [Streptomyces sp. NPDC020883]|uniref:hypothetical protein n=1 Tax=Streptomyces sp. NPDC020883 TaxID=3365099 RepID=UPI003790E74E